MLPIYDREIEDDTNTNRNRSGRFILAKFFAAHIDDNIDIEFIGAYGFVGRRFFPAITPR